jgi:transposase
MSAGRPTKYKEAYCDEVITHMAEGASLTSFAAEIGVARSSINEWMAAHPEFSEAVNVGKAKCAAWWEKINRSIAKDGGGTGSAQACALGLKNMAADDWREKSELDVNVKTDLADTLAKRRKRVIDEHNGG